MNFGNLLDHIEYSDSKRSASVEIESATRWQEGLMGTLAQGVQEGVAGKERLRLAILGLASLIVALLIITRAFQLQILSGREQLLYSEENRMRVKRIAPERGVITDREGEVLATNIPAFYVGMDLIIAKDDYREVAVSMLSEIVKVPESELEKKIARAEEQGLQEVILAQGLDRDTVIALEASSEQMPGVYCDVSPMREYPYGEVFAHIVGYVGEISEEELGDYQALQYIPGDYVGKAGVERVYEEYLHGRAGRRLLESNAAGTEYREVAIKGGESGRNITLSVDSSLQEVSHKALSEMIAKSGGSGGAVVVQEVDTGAVLALVSLPTFDANLFAPPLTEEEYSKLVNRESQPFYNRAISGQYPPASTFKIVGATGILEEGVLDSEDTIEEVQTITVGGHSYSNWTLLWGLPAHGPVDLTEALAYSSDIYFYEASGGYKELDGLGIERLSYWAREFGFGSTLGIDLYGEEEGVVPTPAYKQRVRDEAWFVGDTYITAIGQGDVLATPLQVNAMMAAVANGGTVYRPHVAQMVITPSGGVAESFSPVPLRRIEGAESLRVVAEGVREAVVYGTASYLQNHPGEIAGKTGTAETGTSKSHAWFTSYAPYSSPQIAVTVFVEEGGDGSKIALPVAREIYNAYFGIEQEDLEPEQAPPIVEKEVEDE